MQLYAITDVEGSARQQGDVADELRPYVDRSDAKAVNEVGQRLAAERPEPDEAFRDGLKAKLAAAEDAQDSWVVRHLRLVTLGCIVCGLVLLFVALKMAQ